MLLFFSSHPLLSETKKDGLNVEIDLGPDSNRHSKVLKVEDFVVILGKE